MKTCKQKQCFSLCFFFAVLALLTCATTVRATINPHPADATMDVPTDVILSWTPEVGAISYHIYFGANQADVATGTGGTDMGTQTETSYTPGALAYGQIYYWRVDEFDGATTHTGNVWRFTVEAVAYRMSNITATASSCMSNMGPEKTIDGSGINTANDQHGTVGTTMWLSASAAPQPTWIRYEFDKVYKLYQMWVWNSNQTFEPIIGFGLKSVKVEYSLDGMSWAQLGGVTEFARAPGSANYVHNTTVNFGGVMAKYVRITVLSNWKGIVQQYGLSEVRFFYIPTQAREPNPTDGQTGVVVDTVIRWRAGREAATHNLYISTNMQEVVDGTVAPVNISVSGSYASYTPGDLTYGTTYYWRVDEFDGTMTHIGEVWSFTTTAAGDSDGVPDTTEDGAPNGGDGNGDGTPDSQQDNVASLPNAADGQYVTIVSPAGTALENVSADDNPSPGDTPAGVGFPVGFFEFTVSGIESGGSTMVTLLLPAGQTVGTYYKYGRTPDNPAEHWYEFLWDGATGAEILPDRIILHFVDGQRGDDDLTANGQVVEPGAPTIILNKVPVAEAGPDQTVEATGSNGATVTLNGSGSTDPDSSPGTNDDIVSFNWYEGGTLIGSGEVITHTFPLGVHNVTLIVTDSKGETDSDEVVIVVQDTTPPTLNNISANPNVLWPANHKMVEVTVTVDCEDIGDAALVCFIVGVTCNEPVNGPGDGNTEPDWDYTDDPLVVLLRAERAGSGSGRVYTIHVNCVDASGNIATATVDVTVPHDKGKK
jgi:hypothetical protein